jgi:hypothetical protein
MEVSCQLHAPSDLFPIKYPWTHYDTGWASELLSRVSERRKTFASNGIRTRDGPSRNWSIYGIHYLSYSSVIVNRTSRRCSCSLLLILIQIKQNSELYIVLNKQIIRIKLSVLSASLPVRKQKQILLRPLPKRIFF